MWTIHKHWEHLTPDFVNKITNLVDNFISSNLNNSQILRTTKLIFCEQNYKLRWQFNFIPCEQFTNIEKTWPHILWTRLLSRLSIWFYPMWTILKYWEHLAPHFANKITNSVGYSMLSNVNNSQILRTPSPTFCEQDY